MKKIFKAYQTPSPDEFTKIWNDCLFVVDTNVLLSLYRYSESTRDELLGMLENYKDRLWLPHQVGLEFFRNRVKVILDQTLTYDQLSKDLDKITSDYSKALDDRCSRHPFIDAKDLKDKFIESMNVIKEDITNKKNNHPDLMGEDKTLESINNLFENKVGVPFTEDELKKLYKDAEERYKNKTPPGYEDGKKEDERKYGDYIVWRQILNKAIEVKKPVILITDDRKNDWWLNVNGRTISPRPELIEEMRKSADADFYMYQSDTFVKYAAKLLKEPITDQRIDKAVREIQEVRSDEESKAIEKEDAVGKALREYLANTYFPNWFDPSILNENKRFFKFNDEYSKSYIDKYNQLNLDNTEYIKNLRNYYRVRGLLDLDEDGENTKNDNPKKDQK